MNGRFDATTMGSNAVAYVQFPNIFECIIKIEILTI
jgi:hypothetical protein